MSEKRGDILSFRDRVLAWEPLHPSQTLGQVKLPEDKKLEKTFYSTREDHTGASPVLPEEAHTHLSVGEGVWDAVTEVKGRMMYKGAMSHSRRCQMSGRYLNCKARAGRPRGHGRRSCIPKLGMLKTEVRQLWRRELV